MDTLLAGLWSESSSFFNRTFSSRPEIPWIHASAEIFLALSFYLLALGFIYFFYKRKDVKLRGVFLPVLFLTLSAAAHTLNIAAPWHPVYAFGLVLKLAAALFAVLTVIYIRRLLPRCLNTPHPSKLQETIEQLEQKSNQYKEKELKQLEAYRGIERAHEETRRELQQTQRVLSEEIKSSDQEMDMLPALLKSLEGISDFYTALEIASGKICSVMDWHYCETWMVAENGKVLELSPACYGNEHFEELRRISQELRFPPNIDFPGRIWADQNPQCIPDLPSEPNGTFIRAQICQKMGLKAAFGFPLLKQGKVYAVLVFLAKNFRERDRRRLGLVSAALGLLTCVLEGKAIEKALNDAQEQQEKRIRERTKELLRANEELIAQIEEHHRIEAALRGSQENFSTLLNSIDGIIWEFDLLTGKFSFVSEQAERILGYPADHWFIEPTFWQDHIHGGDRARALSFRARVAQEKKDDRLEYRMITADGKTIWMRDMVTVVVEKDETIKLRGVMVNITEPKQVEEALNQERNFVSAIFETAGALVMVLDTEGRIVRFNRACEQTSGYTADEAKGKFFWDLFSISQEVEKAKTVFTRLQAGQFPINDESTWVAKDGTRHAIAWSNTVLLNKYGAVIHVIATGVDITKRKEVEQKLKEAVADLARSNKDLDNSSQELKRANQQLRELDEIKSHFISAASHELRTPLTSIKGYVESILEDEVGPLNEKQREFLSYVKTSTERLHRLLNELLDISKIESGQVKMNKDLANLKDVLREEMMIFKAQAQQKGVELNIEMDMNLREIFCDADKIREVMDNLISNAIKYTPAGGVVKIEAQNTKNGSVQIDVLDTGIGISKEDLNRVFEPFQRIEKNGIENSEESTGLGLTLVKRIVEAHEGSISVKSQEGKGSIFTVVLPSGSRSAQGGQSPWLLALHKHE